MISSQLNDQSERLEKQINEIKNIVLQTMEEKMDAILQESEKRMIDRMDRLVETNERKMEGLIERVSKLEESEANPGINDERLNRFTTTIKTQMVELTNRLGTKLNLIRENTVQIAAFRANQVCPNEGRVTRVEGTVDHVCQDRRNYTLILTGLRPEYQNTNGVIGLPERSSGST